MKSQKTLRVIAMLVAGLLMFSFFLIEDVCGDDQDQTQDQTQDHDHDTDPHHDQDPDQDQDRIGQPQTDEALAVVLSGDQDQDQDHDHDTDPHHDQDPDQDQDRDRTGWDDLTDEALTAMLSEECDCLCQCCQNNLCTCCKNCLCLCCRDNFCTSREIRLLIYEDESFLERVENQFRVRNIYLKAPGGGEDESSGNCLSYPVIWADGFVALRGEYGSPFFGGHYRLEDPEDPDSTKWYLQQDELNAWQAESHTWNGGDGPLYISDIAWGDNLYARDWTLHSVVRVETVLYASYESMDGFEMRYLFGEGPDEMQGTNGETEVSSSPTVYTPQARLTIQRWLPESVELIWDPDTKLWVGAEDPIVSGGYSAEINVKGKVIFGYNWFVRDTADDPGLYRVTMWLENSDAVIDSENGLTYVDVGITDAAAGGGGGGGGNGGDGGGDSTLVADFEAIPTSVESGETVYFTDTSSGNPKSWIWEFGDGGIAMERNPSHTYYVFDGDDKTFTVRLTIGKGTKTASVVKADYITVTSMQLESSTTMHIETIDMDDSTKGKMHYVETTVTVNDENQEAVSNATVELLTTFPDSSTKTKSLKTGENGTVTFYVNSRLDGEYISEVIDVSHSSREYKTQDNDVDKSSLVVY